MKIQYHNWIFFLLGLLIILVWPSPIRFVEQFNDQFSLTFRQIAFCKSFVCNDRIKIIANRKNLANLQEMRQADN